MTERQLFPSEWVECALGQVVETIRGVSYAKEQAATVPKEGYLPILRATNIDRAIHFEDFVFVPNNLVSSEQLLRLGDVVIAASSGSKNIVGKAAQLSRDWKGSFGAFCMGIRPTPDIESRFVGHFLQSHEYRHQVSKLAAGSNINNLKREHIELFPFRLAPLNEQRRIADKIDELLSDLDAGVAALERARANLKRYRAAVLKAAVEGRLTAEWRKAHPDVEPASELLERILAERRRKWEEAQLAKFATAGKPPPKGWKDKYSEPAEPDTTSLHELPEGWCWATTDQLFWYVTSGSRGWAAYYSDEGPQFIRIANLDHFRIGLDLSKLQHVTPPSGTEGERTRVFTCDLLISITADVGMIGYVEQELGEAYINQHIALARGAFPEVMEYLAWYLTSESGQVQFKRLQRGATKVGLGLDDIRAVRVPLPPRNEQTEIIGEIDAAYSSADKSHDVISQTLGRSGRLRQSILKRAFEGRLVPQDANDEPASALLERIRAARAAEAPALRARKGRKSSKSRAQ